MSFLTTRHVAMLAYRTRPYGFVIRGIGREEQLDVVVEFPLRYDGLVLADDPIILQLDGRTYATLLSGAMGFLERCECWADPMKNDSEWRLQVNCTIRDNARWFLKLLTDVLDMAVA